MGMALKADVTEACYSSGTAKPVDLVHLATQTMGDKGLEAEVLSIFKNQCALCLTNYKEADNSFDRKQAAHLLKGSSRGIGAWKLAELAGEAEKPGFKDIKQLESCIEDVISYIDKLYH